VRCMHAVVQVVAIILPDAGGGRAHHRPPASATVWICHEGHGPTLQG
jgi:hypothetical protein